MSHPQVETGNPVAAGERPDQIVFPGLHGFVFIFSRAEETAF
jgi:hypothetical protein